MQYGFYINQKALVEISKETGCKLDLRDGALIEFVAQYSRSGEIEVRIIDGEPYYWVAYSKIIEECPLLEIENKEVLARRMNNIAKAGILKKHYSSGQEKKTYFAFGKNYIRLIKHLVGSDSSHADSKVRVVEESGLTAESHADSKVEAMPTQKSNNQYTKISTTTTPKKTADENFGNWEPTEMTTQTIARTSPDLSLDDIQTELTRFILYYSTNWPKNPDMRFIRWCQDENPNYARRKAQKERNEVADQAARQRMQEYHEKKQENMAKGGSGSKPRGNEVKVIDPYDFESYDDYQAAVDEASERNEPVKILEPSVTRYRIWGVSPPQHGSVIKSPDYSSGYSEQEMEAKKNQIMQEYAQ